MIIMMVWLVLLFVWGSREGTEGQCFALVYGAPRSHLTFDHCASTSSSVEIADRGGSKLSDVTLPHQEGNRKYKLFQRTNTIFTDAQIHCGTLNKWKRGGPTSETGHFPRKVLYHVFS